MMFYVVVSEVSDLLPCLSPLTIPGGLGSTTWTKRKTVLGGSSQWFTWPLFVKEETIHVSLEASKISTLSLGTNSPELPIVLHQGGPFTIIQPGPPEAPKTMPPDLWFLG